MARRSPEPFDCPNCGADVPAQALACPECGSDEQTGWSDDTIYDGVDLPGLDEDFGPTPPPSTKHAFYAFTALGLVVLFFWFLSMGGRLW